MIPAQRAVKASAAFEALWRLNPEVAELREAGVATHTVLSLYPASFVGVAGAIHEHLLSHSHILRIEPAYSKQLTEKNSFGEIRLFSKLGTELREQWQKDYVQAFNSEEVGLLINFIRAKGGWTTLSSQFAKRFTAALWRAWWAMAHRAELPPTQQEAADAIMIWCDDLLLVDLVNC
jgi:hypothetical protein